MQHVRCTASPLLSTCILLLLPKLRETPCRHSDTRNYAVFENEVPCRATLPKWYVHPVLMTLLGLTGALPLPRSRRLVQVVDGVGGDPSKEP
jgi:hypothetical protein